MQCFALMATRRVTLKRIPSAMAVAVCAASIALLVWAQLPIATTSSPAPAPLRLNLSHARFVRVAGQGFWIFPGRHVCLSGPSPAGDAGCVRAYNADGGLGGTPIGAAPTAVSIVLASGKVEHTPVTDDTGISTMRGMILVLTFPKARPNPGVPISAGKAHKRPRR